MVGFPYAGNRWLRSIDRIATCRIKSQTRYRGNYTRPRPPWIHRISLWYIGYGLLIIHLSSSWLAGWRSIRSRYIFYQLHLNLISSIKIGRVAGFNHRNLSLSIISEYRSIFGLVEIWDLMDSWKLNFLIGLRPS